MPNVVLSVEYYTFLPLLPCSRLAPMLYSGIMQHLAERYQVILEPLIAHHYDQPSTSARVQVRFKLAKFMRGAFLSWRQE